MPRGIDKYLRLDVFPTPFCPGCGHGIVLGSILRAVDALHLDFDRIVFVSGIGCAAWIPSPHFAADTMHVTHGRALAFATGIKRANPALKVIVISGDGDIAAIGGNHLIHAARRNIDLTVICANNSIYGMTGGQCGPTTPCGARTVTSPEGNPEAPFDLCRLVLGAGAGYVARTTVYHARDLTDYVTTALGHRGFSFVEAISPCFTQFGRRNQFKAVPEMYEWLRASTRRARDPLDIHGWTPQQGILSGEFARQGSDVEAAH
jgi:2-oxoglutarate ferredoxin oxidoreductase subunit beta